MSQQVKITVGELEAKAMFNDTETAKKVLGVLPVSASVNVWGEEIYFNVPVEADLENAVETVNMGDIAYWPQGNALCIFFGRTPVSEGDEIRPISAVNVIGEVEGSPRLFRDLLDGLRKGEHITISK